jgi:phosphoribosylformylglycinamidine synthase
VLVTDIYFLRDIEGRRRREDFEEAASTLFSDPVTQAVSLRQVGDESRPEEWQRRLLALAASQATVFRRAGVMDPVEASTLRGLADLGIAGVLARTAARYYFFASGLDAATKQLVATKVISNPAIEDVVWDDAAAMPSFHVGGSYRPERIEVALKGLDDAALLEVSRKGQLSLNLAEMRAIRDHFAALGRAPTDAELETLAQTWSEHCCHKTFTGIIEFRRLGAAGAERRERIDNLLKHTIRAATERIAAPWCLSVFEDNAGVVEFDHELGVSFKVETHNHPSAIEPYGGAGTGVGGVIRDTLGTGLGARPIVNTDVFCFGPPELPWDALPPGALHPLRVLSGVVAGVRDYGNRMGIPTASGAIYFDERYVGNPLVYCGSVGIIPRSAIRKQVRPGDRIYALGGRTGRDGIHGATFSSLELTEESELVSSGAVQIGNAITEKKVLDVLLQARDAGLFRSVTDCGAGGFSSAVGEMGRRCGARVRLERVPLKYEGLTYTEIWISEAQERMVLAVPPENAAALEALARSEDVECTDIGEFTDSGLLELLYEGLEVAKLSMAFLHDGIPRLPMEAVYREPAPEAAAYPSGISPGEALHRLLRAPNIASKEWVIRQYDHEVQGQSVLKSLVGPQRDGPGDAVAFAPRPESSRAIVIGCGMNPSYGDLDPYRMAALAVDEAIRNVVAVGGDPERTAILDNFSWGNTRRPEVLGALVEAARGCRDAAIGFGTPFISGKDSLNNEFLAGGRTISIPPSLLVSSLSMVEDLHALISMDFKGPGHALVLVGDTREELGGSHYFRVAGGRGGSVPAVEFDEARRRYQTIHRAIRAGWVLAAHDLSEGGLAVAAAEMAFAGGIGCRIRLDQAPGAAQLGRSEAALFSESASRLLLEVPPERLDALLGLFAGQAAAVVGETIEEARLRILDGAPDGGGRTIADEPLAALKQSWQSLNEFLGR